VPLVLSLAPGQDFFVDDDRLVVGPLLGKSRFEVTVEKTGVTHQITDEEAAEVLPDVFLSAGRGPAASLARVVVDAPQQIIILRGDKYREYGR